jgi:hypothetical protein
MHTTTQPTKPVPGARLPLPHAAARLQVTSLGALKILQRAGAAIRDDGRWYVEQTKLDAIAAARRVLGTKRRIRSVKSLKLEAAE